MLALIITEIILVISVSDFPTFCCAITCSFERIYFLIMKD